MSSTPTAVKSEISSAAAQQLAHVEPQEAPTTVQLDRLGCYRVIAMRAHGIGETIVTGLPTSEVDDTLLTVAIIFSVVGAVALIGGTVVGIVIIRRQLAPLSTVSAAARQVADLELDRGARFGCRRRSWRSTRRPPTPRLGSWAQH